jgi:hypothetical protein
MATTICNPLVINLATLDNTLAAAARTYTTTRQLRMYDLKVFYVDDPGLGTYTCTVSNGATVCITKVSPLNPDQGDITRLGQTATDTMDDAQMVVAAGDTIVFAYDDNDAVQALLYCWTL